MRIFKFTFRRILWTELNDLNYFPQFLKTPYLDCLAFVLRVGGYYRNLGALLADICHAASAHHIQDFGSGSGNHVHLLLKSWPPKQIFPEVIVSDLAPNSTNFVELTKKYSNVYPMFKSVNMTTASVRDQAVVTMFSCFHHLNNPDSLKAVKNLASQAEAVVIVEPFERSLFHIFKHLLLFPFGILAGMFTPFLLRFSWNNLLFCTILPLAPVCVQIDGIISVLRSFRYKEIEQMLQDSGLKTEIRGYAVIGLKPKKYQNQQSTAV